MSTSQRVIRASGAASEVRPMDQWLETNGLGGYACGTLCGVRQWPAQGMLVVARRPPIDRHVLLASFNVSVQCGDDIIHLTTHRFEGDRLEPDARQCLARFETRPWPRWTWDLGGGRVLHSEVMARQGANQFVYSWQVERAPKIVLLRVQPLLAGRPMNSARRKLDSMVLEPERPHPRLYIWKLRPGSPSLALLSDGTFEPDPHWKCGFQHDTHSTEDLACPGDFVWELAPHMQAHMIASTAHEMEESHHLIGEVAHLARTIRNAERTRRGLFRSELDRAANSYIVQGSEGKTLLSGFPRGTEMGSQAMIAMRGICVSAGRLDTAHEVLETWRGRLSLGMLPMEISEHQRNPSWHSPEPSLWFIIATYEYFRASYRQGRKLPAEEREALEGAILHIVRSFHRHRHQEAWMDEDGLIVEKWKRRRRSDSEPEEIKRVRVQALWINALWIAAQIDRQWEKVYRRTRVQFNRAFWSEEFGYLLHAVVHRPHETLQFEEEASQDQALAVGGLPLVCVDEGRASLIISVLEERYASPEAVRQAASIPWLFGPFIEGWYRVRHREPDVLAEVMRRFIDPWESHMYRGGLSHLPEHMPLTARGAARASLRQAPFSAVETSELLRILHMPDLERNLQPFDDRLNRAMHL